MSSPSRSTSSTTAEPDTYWNRLSSYFRSTYYADEDGQAQKQVDDEARTKRALNDELRNSVDGQIPPPMREDDEELVDSALMKSSSSTTNFSLNESQDRVDTSLDSSLKTSQDSLSSQQDMLRSASEQEMLRSKFDQLAAQKLDTNAEEVSFVLLIGFCFVILNFFANFVVVE